MHHPAALPEAALAAGRMHEVCGPGGRVFAAAQAGRMAGPVLWVMEARERERLCPAGLAAQFDPARLVIARPTGRLGVLQVMEEALRSGAVPLVIGELDRATDLTQSRRLQLAAGTGGATALCLVPMAGLRSNACETRWQAAAIAGPPGAAAQRWQLVKTRRGRPASWDVTLAAPASPRDDPARPDPQPARAAARRGAA